MSNQNSYQPIESLSLSRVAVAGGIKARAGDDELIYIFSSMLLEGKIDGRLGHIEVTPAFMAHTGEVLLQATIREGARRPAAIDQLREVDLTDLVLLDAPPPLPPPQANSNGRAEPPPVAPPDAFGAGIE